MTFSVSSRHQLDVLDGFNGVSLTLIRDKSEDLRVQGADMVARAIPARSRASYFNHLIVQHNILSDLPTKYGDTSGSIPL